MLPVYQVAAGGGITEEELPGSVVHFHSAARSHHCSPVTLTFLFPRVELLRTVNCGEPCSGGNPGHMRFSTGSGNGYDLRTVLECAYKPRGGSREDGDLRVD